MIGNQITLLKRELWEHRSIFVTPIVIGVLASLMAITAQVSVSGYDYAIDAGILKAASLGAAHRAAVIGGVMMGVGGVFVLAMLILIAFYCLDCLYAERKDRSILFWRSMPCTDTETVLSKLLIALIVIPLLTFVIAAVTHIVVLTSASIWIGFHGGNAGHLIWASAPLQDIWVVGFVFLLAVPLWLSPFVGWFLLVSAYARRSPLLLAFLPILILPMLEKSLAGTSYLADAIFRRSVDLPLFHGVSPGSFLFFYRGEGEYSSVLLSNLDLAGFFASSSLWIGILVCALFATAAVYLRRYRNDG